MTDKSPSELERDAERVRAELADTTEQLKEKMTPGQLMDEVVGYFKDGDTNQLLSNLKGQVRDNPLALALVGGGLAWLMMGSGQSSGRPVQHFAARPASGTNGARSSARSGASLPSYGSSLQDGIGERTASPGPSGIGSTLREGAAAASHAAGDAASAVRDAAGAVTDTVSSGLNDLRSGAGAGLSHAVDAGADVGARVRNTFLDTLEREPLVIGALGVAVGAAIGAMLPATRTEQEYLAPAGEKVREAAETALADGLDKAKHVAGDVYSAAKAEADRQGLTGGKPMGEKVTEVARAAGNELRSGAEQSLHEAGERAEKATDGLSPSPRR